MLFLSLSTQAFSYLDDNPHMEMAAKHSVVQEVLVNEVYLGGEPSLVAELGFGEGEEGYVFMQCAMSEHQVR